jgi:hypothetical protein
VCADDVVTGANSKTELQCTVIEWASVCREKGMESNARKNKTLSITKGIQKTLSIEWGGGVKGRSKWRR